METTVLQRLSGGALAGLLAGLAMYLTLAVTALVKGLGMGYPLLAVQALMSGTRVLPDPPSVASAQVTDWLTGPLDFFFPAVLVGILTAWWVDRRARRADGGRGWRAALAPALALTALFFVVFVLVLGFRESEPAIQKISTGYGIRQLGLTGWVLAHLVYLAVLVPLLTPVTQAVAAVRARRSAAAGSPGERIAT